MQFLIRGTNGPKRKKPERNGLISLKRAKWTPTSYLVICSEHFKPEDFLRRFSHVEGESFVGNRWLKRDEIGICVFPTIMPSADAQKVSDRYKRMFHYYVVEQSQKKSKAAPKCRACEQPPMKGHKFVTDCPRNERSTS
ncbi:Hypothetical predicted protein [Paramuricea clavata]|uniref:Uncharacterized protein n=1 Tax=Paramuricea clavata TaxID=317549 RepID=A0A6S7JJG8_PARCT|nr:Hypothetical predicted protein [Paramuricea clavata]